MKKAATNYDYEAVIGYTPRYNQHIYKQRKGSDSSKPRRQAQNPSPARLLSPARSYASSSYLSSPGSIHTPRPPPPRAPKDMPRQHRQPTKGERPTTARPRLPALADHKSVVHMPDKVPDDENDVSEDVVLPSMAARNPNDWETGDGSGSDEIQVYTGGEAAEEAEQHVNVCHEWLADLESSARTAQPKGPVNCTRWILGVKQYEMKQESEQMLTQMQSSNKNRSRVLALGKALRSTTASKDSHWMQYLRSLPLLAGMKQAELDKVYARLTAEEFSRGSYVLRQDQTLGEDAFVIFRGVASAHYTDSEGRMKKMAILREHASFGGEELVCCPSTKLGYNADIVAETELACLRIPRKVIGGSDPEVPGHGRPISPTKAAEMSRRTKGMHLNVSTSPSGGSAGEDEAYGARKWNESTPRLRRRSSVDLDWSPGTDTVGWVMMRGMLKERVVLTESRKAVTSFIRSKIDLFRRAPSEEMPTIMSKIQLLYFIEGDKLLQQGERGGTLMYVLYEGKAEAMQYSARTGEMKSVGFFSKGDAFGAGAVLKSEAYEASVFARSDCKLIGIPRASLLDLGLFEKARQQFQKERGEQDMDWAALKQHFGAFDKDNDGTLDRHEMHQLLGSLGFRYLPNEFDLGFTMIETKLGSTIDFYAFKDFWLRCNFLDPLNVKELGEVIRETRAVSVSPEPGSDFEVWETVPLKSEEEEEVDALMAQAAEDARSIWNRYDVDRSNALDKYEIRMLLIDLGFKDCSAARIERELVSMDRNDNGEVDFEEFIYWWMSAKVQTHLGQDPHRGPNPATWIQGHHPSIELSEAVVREYFELLHKDREGQVSAIDMMKGVCAHPEEAVQFGFTTAVHEVDKEKIVVAFDAMRQPGTHRITVDDMVNYFGPMGKVRGSGSMNSAKATPRSATKLWQAVRTKL